MKKFFSKLKADPRVAHVLRAVARFTNRMGPQFAAGITYFTVLSIVPILMVAFAVLGMTVTTINPALMDQLKQALMDRLGNSGMKETIGSAVENALQNWGTIGIVGLGSAIYAGSGWIGNLKNAIRAQMRPEMENKPKAHFILIEVAINVAILLGLLVLGGASVAVSTIGSGLNTTILHAIGLNAAPQVTFLIWIASFAIAALSGTVLFLYIFWVMPEIKPKRRQWLLGSLGAGIVLGLLQSFAASLMRLFGGNAAATAFGPIIVLMLVFNLFAQVTLLIAGWIATTNQPAVAREYNEADLPLRHRQDLELADDHWAQAEEDKRYKEMVKQAKKEGIKPEDLPKKGETSSRPQDEWSRRQVKAGLGPQLPPQAPGATVPQEVAAKGVRAGMGAGYVVGAATGVGLGALAGRVVHAVVNRSRRTRR